MPMTGSTLTGGTTFRRIFGLISSASTDGTALSLTIAHGLGTALVPNATIATQNIRVNICPRSLAGGGTGWFVASIDATNVIFGRSEVMPGAAAAVSAHAYVEFAPSLID